MSAKPDPLSAFRVGFGTAAFASFVRRFPRLWVWLANLETRQLEDELESIDIDRPIYVGGLARSGSTILLEMLAHHRDVATHRYEDFPPLFTPYWWGRLLEKSRVEVAPVERAHGDRLLVTPQSPEAMEEILWKTFFPASSDPDRSDVLDATTKNARFERFYAEHLKKLLLVRKRRRYVTKGNYNVARFEYIQSMFPSARFVVPIRAPREHIASSKKQHDLFCRAQKAYPRARAQLRNVEHFEFGLDRRPIHIGDPAAVRDVADDWAAGNEVGGWARYWSLVYGTVEDALDRNEALRESTLVVHYEELCAEPRETIAKLLDHCGLDDAGVTDAFADRLSLPSYYEPDFTAAEEAAIAEHTSATAARFGYG